MILELDCGNTRIKWRLLQDGAVIQRGSLVTLQEIMSGLQPLFEGQVQRCRVVSVWSGEATQALIVGLKAWIGHVECAKPQKQLLGVTNGYSDYKTLGMDRWLAVVAAYQKYHEPALIFDFGTALTADYVDATGQHLGGFIVPGVELMRASLCSKTQRIRYSPDNMPALGAINPQLSTISGVEQGLYLMIRGFVEEQKHIAKRNLGERFHVFVAGGDGQMIIDLFEDVHVANDLVFDGLALACPFE
ncbi:type III pantothenate kinase [Pseudomonas sp. F1_0610]|uniref:type III pantothenate kinase n=1 Tax=Pseudomonas sp. F1_0610 TaxID=3114284 RepID=UPI0039C3C6D0